VTRGVVGRAGPLTDGGAGWSSLERHMADVRPLQHAARPAAARSRSASSCCPRSSSGGARTPGATAPATSSCTYVGTSTSTHSTGTSSPYQATSAGPAPVTKNSASVCANCRP
jgi:hypothetical protein